MMQYCSRSIILPCFGPYLRKCFYFKQVGGICGALLTNLSAWLSGIWFDVDLVGGAFKKIANVLPFIHAVELERAAFNADYSNILPHLLWVLGYMVVAVVGAVFLFLRQMKKTIEYTNIVGVEV